uniref:Uncharacterized protein n=1 Tax=Aegilops tauschii subsp. strangulata TaxID=200361 RepID=A0A452ZQG5_AEGTS
NSGGVRAACACGARGRGRPVFLRRRRGPRPPHARRLRRRRRRHCQRHAGLRGRVDGGVRLGGAGRARRARRQGLPDLAGAARRPLQDEAQSADCRDDRGACEPGRVGGEGPDEVAVHLRRGRPVRERRRHHRRRRAGVVGALLQAQEDPGTTSLVATSQPAALHFEECRGVSVQGVTLQNGPQFHLSFTRCVDVKASFLRLVAPADSPNTDGIHLNDSSRVQITDNLISTGDDCVSMVGNCSDVRVRDISCGPGHGISIGSLGKNRTTDRVENVRVDTCLLTNTTNGVRIKSWQGGMGSARDLRFESIVMKNVSNPIIIDQYYCDQPTPCANQTEAVEVRKVEFVDVRGTSATARAIKIACSDTAPCTELELRNVNLTVVGGGAATASCYRASGKAAGVVAPASCLAKG